MTRQTSSFSKLVLVFAAVATFGGTQASAQDKPNIVYILADDLGYNELGCYGQTQIKTPNIDQLAKQGMSFTQHYSGSAVCAPTRCIFLTGLHAGHAQVRNNSAGIYRNKNSPNNPVGEGQYPLAAGTETVGTMLQRAGYKTCAVGKWGVGGPFNAGDPNKQGFDHFFGYLCQREAHNYFPTHLWRNDKPITYDGNEGHKQQVGKHYAPDQILQDALDFIDASTKTKKSDPFFLYYATIIPHVSLQVPLDDPGLAEYQKTVGDPNPFKGGSSYVGNKTPHATYAAMITRMDRNIGKIVGKLKERGVYKNTLIIFTSDNGPTNAGGGGAKFFNSAGMLRGLKGSLYEGGIRVPFVASWPGQIKPASRSDHPSAGWDMLATFADVVDQKLKAPTDGVSMLPTLIGEGQQKAHDHMYWELGTQQAVRAGDWKVYRKNGGTASLFDLGKDPGEKNDLAKSNPEKLAELSALFASSRTSHADFKDPFGRTMKPKQKKKKKKDSE
ncbi:MAG: arylsulfatase [Mariniblastus sp.]|nr:arylsulfatase [Mariniblastus sp.]